MAEWAGLFAATALKRRAVAAGAVALVSAREADDLVRDAGIFYAAVAGRCAVSRARPVRSTTSALAAGHG